MSGGPAAGNPPAAPSSAAPSVGTGDTVLTIVVDDGKGTVTTHRLTCTPVGGDHPEPEAACQALQERGAEALPAVPSDRFCTQNFAGPQSATVRGLWQGREVDSRFNLRNGCEIARWKALNPLLPPVEG